MLAATLAEVGKLDLRLRLVSVFLGIWIGDMGLYAVGSGLGHRVLGPRWLGRYIPEKKLQHAQDWFSRRGVWALVISRVIPGSRLPLYFTAGALRFSTRRFAGVTGICAAVWVSLIFAVGSLAVKTLRGPWGIVLILGTKVGAFAIFYVFEKSQPRPSRAL